MMERQRRSGGTFLPEPVSTRFWRFVSQTDGCWEWLGAKSDGYGTVHHAHGASVLHRCDVRACVNPAHLFIGTSALRPLVARSALFSAMLLRGHRSPRAKLTRAQAAEIKRRRLSGETVVALASEFHIHHGTVSRIAKAQTWSEL